MNADSLRISPSPEMGAQWLETAAERQRILDEELSHEPLNTDRIVLLKESVHRAEGEAAYHLGGTGLQGVVEQNFKETA